MIKNKIILLSVLIIGFLAISSVNAVDDSTDDAVTFEEKTDEIVNLENNYAVLKQDEDLFGNFSELSGLIESTNDGDTLELSKDYKFLDDDPQSIEITKAINIDGKGFKLININTYDEGYFRVNSNNVLFKNITFDNCEKRIIGVENNVCNFSIINCDFVNNVSTGSAIKFGENTVNCNINNCKFYYNKAFFEGSAIDVGSNSVNCIISNSNFINYSGQGNVITTGNINNLRIINCSFIDNSPESASINIGDNSNNWSIINCSFLGNSVWYGGCISFYNGINNNIVNCTFINNTASEIAGAIYMGSNCNIINCTFINNSATWTAGAIATGYDVENCSIINCSFINNSAKAYDEDFNEGGGSAIFLRTASNYRIINCTFINNAEKSGDSIFIDEANGNYIINCFFENPDNNNIKTLNVESLEIIKRNANLILDNYSFNFLDKGYMNITLKNSSDDLLLNQSIYFNITNNNISKTFSIITSQDNTFLLNNFNNFTVGEWDVIASFNGNDNYYSCNTTSKLIILPPTVSVTVSEVDAKVGYESVLSANIVASSNIEISEGVVTFFDGENIIGDANVCNNTANITYIPITSGKHNITAVFTSDNYQKSNSSILINVSKAGIDLKIEDINQVFFSNPSNFTVIIKSNNKTVNEGSVEFYVNNTLIKSENVENGLVNINYVVNSTGLFTLKVIYAENDNYLSNESSSEFNVTKMPTTLSGKTSIFDDDSQTKTFSVELNDNNSKGVSNQSVNIEAIKYSGESKTFTGQTNASGIIIYDVSELKGGMWIVQGNYGGNDNYIESEFTNQFIVIRMNTTTDIEELKDPKINHSYKLKANIHDEDGKLVKEGIVQFYLDGVDIGSIDLSNNKANPIKKSNDLLGAVNPKFTYVVGDDGDISDLYIEYTPSEIGKHTVLAVYNGTDVYKASNSTSTFTVTEESKTSNTTKNNNVKKASAVKTTLALKKVTVKKSLKKLVLQAKLKVNGKAVSNKKITFKFNGKKFIGKTNKKGIAKVTIKKSILKKLKVGKKIKYQAIFGKTTVTKTVKVKK